jgi:hypothetical protein
MPWIPIASSQVSYSFTPQGDATLEGSTINAAGIAGSGWEILLDTSSDVRLRISISNFAADSGGSGITAVSQFSYVEPDATAALVENLAPNPATAFSPNPVEAQVGAGQVISYAPSTGSEWVVAETWQMLIEVWEPAPIDRKVTVAVSRDGGHNYGAQREASLGELGAYRQRVRFRRFGRGLQFVMKIRVTSPIKADLMDSVVDFEVAD